MLEQRDLQEQLVLQARQALPEIVGPLAHQAPQDLLAHLEVRVVKGPREQLDPEAYQAHQEVEAPQVPPALQDHLDHKDQGDFQDLLIVEVVQFYVQRHHKQCLLTFHE